MTYEKPRCAHCGRVIQTGRAMRVSPHEIESYVVCSLQCAVDSRAPDDDDDDDAAPSSATPATASAPEAVELARLRTENERLRAEVRDLYARLTEVRDVQRSLETLIVAGVAALEAVDRLGLQAPTPATQQSPSLLAWLRGVLVKRPDARPDAPPPRH